MSKLFLLRHLKSQWNLENRFAGWVDNPICKEGADMAPDIAKMLADEKIDTIFTSPLIRNQQTTTKILRNLGKNPLFIHLDGGKMQKWGHFEGGTGDCIKTYVSEKLNERYYGKLQGLNKEEAKKIYGEEQVRLWRRGYDARPPSGESLKDTYNRAVPFYKKYVLSELEAEKNVLIVSSGNSLRAIVKYLENIPDEKIIDLELPFAKLLKYNFDGKNYLKIA